MDYPGKVITKNQVTPTQTSASGNWTLDDAAAATKNNNWPVAGVPNPISKSLRFNSADSAYLSRTFGTPTNNKIWTYSFWVKRSALSTEQELLNANSVNAQFYFSTTNTLNFSDLTSGATYYSSQVFRDVGAWYHIVIAQDTTQATAGNRVKIYVNGSQITAFSTGTAPTQNNASAFNVASTIHTIARYNPSPANYLDGYLTEINFIDGQALTPSSFGMTNPQTGQWIPIKYSGTYGTNGFYLNFKDATSTTTLGYDYSGNANNWTTNNFSVTAGTGNDSLTDVPTPWIAYNTTGDVGGVVRGNYATLNPLIAATVLSNGNLDSSTAAAWRGVVGTLGFPSGKFYYEATITATTNTVNQIFGAARSKITNATLASNGYPGQTADGWGVQFGSTSYKINNGTFTALGSSYSYTTNDVIMVAVDVDAGKFWYGKNGSWIESGNPATGANALFTNLTGEIIPMLGQNTSGNSCSVNFGQRPFAYTPPAGFLSLCTTNLPNPTIGTLAGSQAGNFFNANLYTGTGSAFTLTGVGFQPDFGWFKGRNASSNHWFHDVVRGANPGLSSNNTLAEDTTAGQLTAFASDGYSLPNDTAGYLNFSGRTMVVWSWKAGGTGVTNTAGTITSTVSANTTSGFSVVTYTGTATASTVGHGLGIAPSMIIVKSRSAVSPNGWVVYHISLGASNSVFLNTTGQSGASGVWNSTAPTSTVFSLPSGAGYDNNNNGTTYVAYCFAAVAGYSAFGSYTGNASTDGPFVYLGFRPRFVMIKWASNVESWYIFDTSRGTYNVIGPYLVPNTSAAEATYSAIDILSNGFKLRDSNNFVNFNNTYIYAAFAESPFKFANAR